MSQRGRERMYECKISEVNALRKGRSERTLPQVQLGCGNAKHFLVRSLEIVLRAYRNGEALHHKVY